MSKTALDFAKAGARSLLRRDSWVNLLTGMGDPDRDKMRASKFTRGLVLNDEALETMFYEDPFAAKIVEKLPSDSFRQGLSVKAPAEVDADDQKGLELELTDRLDELGMLKKCTEAATWGRLFGGGVIFVGADDGNIDISKPLDLEKVRSVRFLKVLDKRDLWAISFYADTRSGKYGEPEVYELRPAVHERSGTQFSYGSRIHESRLVIFPGVLTSERERAKRQYWDHSVLTRVYDTLQAAGSDWSSVSSMLHDSSQGILKIKDFWEIISGGAKEVFEERMQIVDLARFVGRFMPIDVEEDFSYQERSFSGIPDLLDRLMMRLASVADMPVTVLMGRSPAGQNATGEADTRAWYDTIKDAQTNLYKPLIERIVSIVASSLDLPEPAKWSVIWPSLWQMNPQVASKCHKTIAESDALYIQNGVLDASELREERFGGDEFSSEAPTVNLDKLVPKPTAEDSARSASYKAALDRFKGDSHNGFPKLRGDARTDLFGGTISADLLAIKHLARVTAPQSMMRALTSRVVDSLGLGAQELHELIGTQDFAWTSQKVGVDLTVSARKDALLTGMPPIALDDLETLEQLTRVRAPQQVLQKLASRVASNLSIINADMEAEIADHAFAWVGE